MNKVVSTISLTLSLIGIANICQAQEANNLIDLSDSSLAFYILFLVLALVFLVGVLYQYVKFNEVIKNEKKKEKEDVSSEYSNYLHNLSSREIDLYLKSKKNIAK